MPKSPSPTPKPINDNPATHFVPFEIRDEHRQRPGWDWLIDRMFQEPPAASQVEDDEVAA